jgi:hypothetical protein
MSTSPWTEGRTEELPPTEQIRARAVLHHDLYSHELSGPAVFQQLNECLRFQERHMAVTRTVTTANPAVVQVAVSSGQFLHFVLDAGGPIPMFSLASNVKGVLYQAPDFPGHPLKRYEWLHLKNPSDIQQMETLELGLVFLSNTDYTYTVELWNAGGLVSTVMQISYKGSGTDIANESFTVVIS